MKTGNTADTKERKMLSDKPQWSPVMKTGNTWVTYPKWGGDG